MTPRVTVKNINAAIATHGVEIVKGCGYFYFAALPGAPMDQPEIDSVYTMRLSDLTFAEWVDHVVA